MDVSSGLYHMPRTLSKQTQMPVKEQIAGQSESKKTKKTCYLLPHPLDIKLPVGWLRWIFPPIKIETESGSFHLNDLIKKKSLIGLLDHFSSS